MNLYKDLDDFFDSIVDSDCHFVNDNRSTSEFDDILEKDPKELFPHKQSYLEKNIVNQEFLLGRQQNSFSQMINYIEEPVYVEPEPEIQAEQVSLRQSVQVSFKQSVQEPREFRVKKHKKNSNAIKKIGRIILNHIQKFQLKNETNPGVEAMMRILNSKSREGENPKDYRDRFNVSHLQALFSECSSGVSNHNLRVAKRLFNKHLRKQILQSFQIKGNNKLIYLNTLKCSSLRFCNKKLALRLQLSQILD